MDKARRILFTKQYGDDANLRFTEADAEELKEFIGAATRNASYPIIYLNNPKTATISIEIPRAGLKTTNDKIKDKAKELGWTVSERVAKAGFISENRPRNRGLRIIGRVRSADANDPITPREKVYAEGFWGSRLRLIKDRSLFTEEEQSNILKAEEVLNRAGESESSKNDAKNSVEAGRLNAEAASEVYADAPPSSIAPTVNTPFVNYVGDIVYNQHITDKINELKAAIKENPNNPKLYEQLALISVGTDAFIHNANGNPMSQVNLLKKARALRTGNHTNSERQQAWSWGGARRTKKRRGYKKRPGNRNGSRSDSRNRNRNQKLTIS